MFKRFFKKNKKEEVKEQEVSEIAVSEEETVEEAEESPKVEENHEIKEEVKEEVVDTDEEDIVNEEETVDAIKEISVDVSLKEEEEESQVEEEVVEEEIEEPKVSLFERLKQGLSKAKQGITDRVDQVLKSYTKVDEDLLEEIEEILITADVGVDTTMSIIDKLTDAIKTKKITDLG